MLWVCKMNRVLYSVTADGKKFLINSGELKEESQPFTIVTKLDGSVEEVVSGESAQKTLRAAIAGRPHCGLYL